MCYNYIKLMLNTSRCTNLYIMADYHGPDRMPVWYVPHPKIARCGRLESRIRDNGHTGSILD